MMACTTIQTSMMIDEWPVQRLDLNPNKRKSGKIEFNRNKSKKIYIDFPQFFTLSFPVYLHALSTQKQIKIKFQKKLK